MYSYHLATVNYLLSVRNHNGVSLYNKFVLTKSLTVQTYFFNKARLMANPDAKCGYLNCWGSFEKAKWWMIVASLSCNA